MKKAKKLVLYRETLRTLEAPVLNLAGAGKPTTLPNTQVTSCDYTLSCPQVASCGICTA